MTSTPPCWRCKTPGETVVRCAEMLAGVTEAVAEITPRYVAAHRMYVRVGGDGPRTTDPAVSAAADAPDMLREECGQDDPPAWLLGWVAGRLEAAYRAAGGAR